MVIHKKGLLDFGLVSVALVVSVLTFACSVEARPPRAVQAQERIRVAGYLDLQGMQVKQMSFQQAGNKSYLFLRRADQNAFAIVDVTNPNRPILVDKSALRELAGGSVELPPPGSALAIAFVPERSSTPAASGTLASDATLLNETVRLIDLSDPREPKTINVFNRVTSVASHDGCELVFLANDEGLWIVTIIRIVLCQCARRSRQLNPFLTVSERLEPAESKESGCLALERRASEGLTIA